jgi:FG-GAP-like repeat
MHRVAHGRIVRSAALFLLAAAAAAQQSGLSGGLILTDDRPRQLEVTDLDGDGRLDLLVLDMTTELDSHFGDGVGGFAPAVSAQAGAGGVTLASSDFDGDGLADVALTRSIVNQVDALQVRMGFGNGSFGVAQLLPLPGEAADLDALDLDADGDLDLIAGNSDGLRISVYRGDGSGVFAPNEDHFALLFPAQIAEGDLDGDGALDLLVGGDIAQSVNVMLGDGQGGFAEPADYDAGANIVDAQLGDGDGDGDLDAILTGESYAGLMLGDGDGGLTAVTWVIVGNDVRAGRVGDLDEDGLADAVYAAFDDARLSVLQLDGPLTFAAMDRYGTSEGPRDLQIADLNGDGDLDLVTANGPDSGHGSLNVLIGFGDGFFFGARGAADWVGDVALGHLDGDGRLDLASMQSTNSASQSLSTWLGRGQGSFGKRLDHAGTVSQSGPVFADVDADGDDDALGWNYAGKEVRAWLSNGDGTLTSGIQTPTPHYAQAAAAGDINGDGLPDVVVSQDTPQQISIVLPMLGNGAGGFTAGVPRELVGDGQPILLTDVTGDGELDAVLAAYAGAGQLTVLPGTGFGSFGATVVSPSFVGANHMASGDLDEDGDRDVATTSFSNAAIVTLRNDGGGAFTATALISTQLGTPLGVDMADFDRDGHVDVIASVEAALFANFDGLAFFAGQGNGTLAAPAHQPTPDRPRGTATGDIDGDGAPDLVLGIQNASQVPVLLNTNGPWQQLGYALGGTQGLPRQLGEGTLQPGAPFAITLRDARPLANAAHVVGLTAIFAPFKGGTYVPAPLLVNYPLPTDASGQLVLSGNWPGTAAPGVDLYFQFWIQDPQGPKGWAASGAVQATLP